jgi:hypothetical protein
MRDFKGMKRQRGRNRGGGGGGKPQHNANRAFESNGPDNVKVRGAAQTIFERYQQLARDASSSGDRVLAENYLQHAEHYFRTLRAMQPNRPAAEIYGRDQYSSGFDIDFEAEPEEASAETAEGGEEGGEGAEAREGGDQQQQQQRRDDYRRDDRQQRDRYENRDRQQRDDRPRDDRPQRDDRPRDDRQQPQQQGEGRRDRRDRWRDRRDDRPREGGDQQREPVAAEAQPAAEPAPQAASPVLRSGDGDISHAPAFLGRATPEPRAEATGEEAPKPVRRRRAPKPAPEEA